MGISQSTGDPDSDTRSNGSGKASLANKGLQRLPIEGENEPQDQSWTQIFSCTACFKVDNSELEPGALVVRNSGASDHKIFMKSNSGIVSNFIS